MIKRSGIFFGLNIKKAKDLNTIIASLALIFVIFSTIVFVNSYSNFKSEVAAEVREQNERIKRRFSDSVLYTKHIMSYIGYQIAMEGAANDYEFINRLLLSYRRSDDQVMAWSTFSWVDKNRNLVVSSNLGVMKELVDMSSRDYIPFTVQYPKNMFMGRPVYGIVSKLWSIPVGYGVIDQRNNYLGTVISGIVISGLKSQIEDSITNRNISFAIIDAKGEVVTQSDNLNEEDNQDFFHAFLRKVAAKTGEKNFSYRGGYYQKFEEYPYGIVTTYNQGFLSSKLRHSFALYVGVVLFIITFFSFIFYVFYRNLLSPLLKLSKFAKISYEGGPIRKLPEFKVAEINELAKNIKNMEKLILEQKQEIKNLTQHE